MDEATQQIPQGRLVHLHNRPFYKIEDVDRLEPFLMTLVSPYDHWLFASSRGGVTAGRVDADQALFPYYTEDKLHHLSGLQGPATQLWVNNSHYWAPFQWALDPFQSVRRHLYKDVYSHQLIFEEVQLQLGLRMQYSWQVSETFGFVRQATLINESGQPVRVSLMDGMRQMLPAGIRKEAQDSKSNLMTAYKKAEWYGPLALYRFSATPIDRAEPAEALTTNVAWFAGEQPEGFSLQDSDWWAFQRQETVAIRPESKGEELAFWMINQKTIEPGASYTWSMIVDCQYNAAQVAALRQRVEQPDIEAQLQASLDQTTQRLDYLLSITDGKQQLGDANAQYRHTSNVLFNSMRGGLLFQDATCPVVDAKHYLKAANRAVANQFADWMQALPDRLPLPVLREKALATGHPDLIRLMVEYMPIGFSRRHGDPSRPWNAFHIHVKDEYGYDVLFYEGNWRDIFQNWEALSHTYPELLPAMVAKFWNASTIDGYNPYRIDKDGVDWEVLDPQDDWSYVGYWGDHQIIYQTKLLERWQAVSPHTWTEWLDKDWFVCPAVPYRIQPASSIYRNAADTIIFDDKAHQAAWQRAEEIGSDGKMVFRKGELLRLNGMEKLLISMSAKLDNLIPNVGIWLNTQRPEWNDANNALVGRGASAVTVYQLRKHVQNLLTWTTDLPDRGIPIANKIKLHWEQLIDALHQYEQNGDALHYLQTAMQAGSDYRESAYQQELGEKTTFPLSRWRKGLQQVRDVLDATITANKRSDQLYHSYHLVQTDGQTLHTKPLYLMLEGQAAILDAGVLAKEEVAQLLTALQASDLYEPRQESYLLYPNRTLSQFMERNKLPKEQVESHPLAKAILAQPQQRLFTRNLKGHYHFHASLINDRACHMALQSFRHLPEWTPDRQQEIESWYEEQFNHSAFTGRSGTFYGYEGLGSIYWHMVSKLVLSTQQELMRLDLDLSQASDQALLAQYRHLQAGIGWDKSPSIYGAIPLDPYSHTPHKKGARQPGMTGQVKEDIINRYGDLGIQVKEGYISFVPKWVPAHWWTTEVQEASWQMRPETTLTLQLAAGSLAFTYAGVVVVYHRSAAPIVQVGQHKVKTLSAAENMHWQEYAACRGNIVLAIQV